MAMVSVEVGAFGDVRRARRYCSMVESAASQGTLVLRRLGGDRAGEVAVQRFLSSDDVTVDALVSQARAQTVRAAQGRRLLLAVQDTSEINFVPDKRRVGLGIGGHRTVKGYFIHPTVLVDGTQGDLVGLAGLQMWTREGGEAGPEAEHAEGKKGKKRRKKKAEERESQRWLAGARAGQTVLAEAAVAADARMVVVSDREGDIFSDMAQIPGERCAMLTRAAQDRSLAGPGRLFAAAAAWAWSEERTIRIERHGGHAPRAARLRLRWGRVSIQRPDDAAKSLPAQVDMTLIEIREDAAPAGHEPLHWYLLYSDEVASVDEAWEVARLYRLRWRIEQIFQLLKSSGFDIEDSEVMERDHLFKLTVLGLTAAVLSQQLVDARDGAIDRPASDVIAPEQIEAARALNQRLQGKTLRQQNPHPDGSMAWFAWIIARLGGWHCYGHKPGAKTMRRGYERFVDRAFGFLLANGTA